MNDAERIEMDEARYAIKGLRGPANRELYLIDDPHPEDDYPSHGTLLDHPGATWHKPSFDSDGHDCWVIVLPNRAGLWWTTYKADQGGLWQIVGSPPKFTVSPSINAGDGPGPGNWHGWIKDGVMTP